MIDKVNIVHKIDEENHAGRICATVQEMAEKPTDVFGSIPDDSMLRKCFCKRLLTKRKRRGCKYGRAV